eukprot:GHVN01021473.1.p1 GENE.GHVN01021473.1~~GHVN01021473.1.p1  ORF type:complete len:240 (-),score=67.90 GHVN01021473.1:154-873(-)
MALGGVALGGLGVGREGIGVRVTVDEMLGGGRKKAASKSRAKSAARAKVFTASGSESRGRKRRRVRTGVSDDEGSFPDKGYSGDEDVVIGGSSQPDSPRTNNLFSNCVPRQRFSIHDDADEPTQVIQRGVGGDMGGVGGDVGGAIGAADSIESRSSPPKDLTHLTNHTHLTPLTHSSTNTWESLMSLASQADRGPMVLGGGSQGEVIGLTKCRVTGRGAKRGAWTGRKKTGGGFALKKK